MSFLISPFWMGPDAKFVLAPRRYRELELDLFLALTSTNSIILRNNSLKRTWLISDEKGHCQVTILKKMWKYNIVANTNAANSLTKSSNVWKLESKFEILIPIWKRQILWINGPISETLNQCLKMYPVQKLTIAVQELDTDIYAL
jgi:hypothetical protein